MPSEFSCGPKKKRKQKILKGKKGIKVNGDRDQEQKARNLQEKVIREIGN